MNLAYIEHYLPSGLIYLYNFLIGKAIFYGILIIATGILLIFFSRYFKYIFFLFYLVFILIFTGYYFNSQSELIIIIIASLLVLMPFLYLAFKNGYSMTVINLFMLGYYLLLFPLIRLFINSYMAISIIIISIFILAVITFMLFLSLKRRMFVPEGEKV